jgi:putative redox protein
MAVTVVWKQGMHFCSQVPSGQLMCDESSHVGAVHPSAPELLLASLGSCTGSVLVAFAARHDIPLEGMQIALDWQIAERPHRIGKITIAVSVPESVSEPQRETLERVAHACLIHNTLTHPPQISLSLAAAPE